MTAQTGSITKSRGLFSRLFGSEAAQPTPFDVDTQILKVQQEQAELQRQRAQLDHDLAEAWGEDTSPLEGQAVALDARIRAAGQVLERLRAEKIESLKRQVVTQYRHRVEGVVAQIVELNSIETPAMLEQEREVMERRAQRARLRAQISTTKGNLKTNQAHYIREVFPQHDAAIDTALIAAMNGVLQEYGEHMSRNIVELDLFERWIGAKDKANE